MTNPITPPPELLQEWCQQERNCNSGLDALKDLATQAARWGADQQLKLDADQIAQAYQAGANQELDACLLCLQNSGYEKIAQCLHDDRRPEPPSLKEEALEALEEIGQVGSALVRSRSDTIRRALEALPND